MKTKLLLSTLLSFSFYLLSSQVPQGFNYQAIARDTTGKPIINTALPVRITIQSDSLGGTRFWIEEHNSVTTNSYGLFNIILGKGVKQFGSTVNTFYDIDWSETPKFIRTEIDKNGWKNMGSSRLWSVPYSMVAGDLNDTLRKLIVKGKTDLMDEALFEVKNRTGQTIFAVYNEGVRVYVDNGAKGIKGGFAIGGFDKTKDGINQDFFIVNRDSVRFYLDTLSAKTKKGGFAIGGFNRSKGVGDEEYLRVTRDSTRIYINDLAAKTRKGGFAIGGFNQTKAGNKSFLNVATDATGVINPSQNRILWYPIKNAFLTGKVLIEKPDSVGVNSFASGYESKAKGMYSQALGYKAIARGDYATAIGKNAVANNINSFAFGDGASVQKNDSYSFGAGAIASGIGSYAIGSAGRDTAGNLNGLMTTASGDYSFALGQGSNATGRLAFAVGSNVTAEGKLSIAMGYTSTAIGDESIAMGSFSTTRGYQSVAMGGAEATENFSYAIGLGAKATANSAISLGTGTTASGVFSTALGASTLSSAQGSTAMGFYTTSSGNAATSMGYQTTASGTYSTAMGFGSVASQFYSTAIGNHAVSSGYGTSSIGVYTTAQALYSVVVGSYNIVSGTYNGWNPSEPIFVVGNGQSNTLRSNAMTITKNGNVGIITLTPQYRLDITSSEALGTFATATVPWQRLYGNSSNQDQLRIYHRRFGAGSDWTTAEIRLQKTVDVTDMGYISFKSDYLEFGIGTAPAITVTSARYVGIGTTNPGTYRLYVSGSSYSSGGWSGSDARWKRNIIPLNSVLDKINNLGGVYYEWRKDEYPEMHFDYGQQIGLIGQDVEKVFPELVKTDINGYKAVSYEKLSVVLLEGIKEQQQQILNQQKEIDELKSLVNRLITNQMEQNRACH